MTKFESHLTAEEIARRQRIQEWADRDQRRRMMERERAESSYAIDLRGTIEP